MRRVPRDLAARDDSWFTWTAAWRSRPTIGWSPTQTAGDALAQQQAGELWGFPGVAAYPKSYFAILILNEADMGNFSETVDEVVKKIQSEVTAKLAALIGAKIGMSGGPIGALIGLLVGYAVGKIFEFLIEAWEDDPFEPQTLELIVQSPDARQTGASEFVTFRGPGEYPLRYSWTLTEQKVVSGRVR